MQNRERLPFLVPDRVYVSLGHSLVRVEGEGVDLHMWMRFSLRSVGVK